VKHGDVIEFSSVEDEAFREKSFSGMVSEHRQFDTKESGPVRGRRVELTG
jgi:hypothetical protein